MSHVSLDEINQQPDAMDSEHFKVMFGNIPGAGDSRPMTINCQTAVIPGFTLEQMEVGLHGHTVRYVGKRTFSGQMSIGFVENSAMDIQKRLRRWAEYAKGTRSATAEGYKADYALTVEIQVMDVTGKIVDELTVFGVWPTDVPETQLDGQSSQAMLVQASFSYDYYRSKLHPYR